MISFFATLNALSKLILNSIWFVRGHSHIDFSHARRQNDVYLKTPPPTPLHVKSKNSLKIDEKQNFAQLVFMFIT